MQISIIILMMTMMMILMIIMMMTTLNIFSIYPSALSSFSSLRFGIENLNYFRVSKTSIASLESFMLPFHSVSGESY